jgi:hypothetical protein
LSLALHHFPTRHPVSFVLLSRAFRFARISDTLGASV